MKGLIALLTSFLAAGCVTERATQFTPLAVSELPYRATFVLDRGDCLLFTLPARRTIALWGKRDTGGGEQETKCHIKCDWGEKPFCAPDLIPEHHPDGTTTYPRWDSYIQGPSVTTIGDRTSAYELTIDDLVVTYTEDLQSTPKLRVTVAVERQPQQGAAPNAAPPHR